MLSGSQIQRTPVSLDQGHRGTPGTIPLAPTAVRNCPHCDQPVTIVALLATQEAARPTITDRVIDISPLRRLQ